MRKLSMLSLTLISSFAFAFEDTAKIIEVVPEYATVIKPIEVCRDETIQETIHPQAQPEEQAGINYGGAAIGGIAGGILGNQVGGGNGKKAATVLGAVAGAMIGNSVANNQSQNNGNIRYEPQVVTRQVRNCRMEETKTKELTGYRIHYVYNGKEFSYVDKERPIGKKLKVSVQVEPILN